MARPELWENVARLAADELVAQRRKLDLGSLLAAAVRPYLEQGQAEGTALLALDDRTRTKAVRRSIPTIWRLSAGDFKALCETASKVLVDWEHFEPEQRNLAGELLGARPEHDTRRGVGLRPDGLPAIDWVEVPELDAQGRREFIYQEDERRVEPTFWMARYPVTYAQFQAFVDAEDGYGDAHWWEGLDAPDDVRSAPGEQAFRYWNHPRENRRLVRGRCLLPLADLAGAREARSAAFCAAAAQRLAHQPADRVAVGEGGARARWTAVSLGRRRVPQRLRKYRRDSMKQESASRSASTTCRNQALLACTRRARRHTVSAI